MNKLTAFESKLEKTSNFSLEKYAEHKPSSSLSHLDKPSPSPLPSNNFLPPENPPKHELKPPTSSMVPPPLPPTGGGWRREEEGGGRRAEDALGGRRREEEGWKKEVEGRRKEEDGRRREGSGRRREEEAARKEGGAREGGLEEGGMKEGGWGGLKVDYPVLGIEKLMRYNELTLRPKVIEKGVERNICYWVFPGGRRKRQMIMEPMFYVYEKENLCEKMINANCRPYEVIVENDSAGLSPFLQLNKECNCTCLCFGRPEIAITHVEEGSNHKFLIGNIFHPFRFCNYTLDLITARNIPRFTIEPDGCALNSIFCCEAECCNKSSFLIKDFYGGRVIGKIEIVILCLELILGILPYLTTPFFYEKGTHYECFSDRLSENDFFTIQFPQMANHFDRMLLFGALIFMTITYFSNAIRGIKRIDF